jgi:WD40 repeat protein
VRVWRIPTGGRFFFFIGHKGGVTKVAFDPTGNFVVSTSLDHTARVWQVGGVEVGTLAALLAGHRDAVLSAAFSPDGRVLATVGLDSTARLWDARITQTLRVAAPTEDQPVTGAIVTKNGDLVYTVGDIVKVRRDGRAVGSFPIGPGAFALSPAGLVASAKRDGTVELDRVPSGRVGVTLPGKAPVAWLAFNADATQLVTTDGKGGIVIWDLATGHALHRFTSTRAPVRVALSPRGDVVATGSENGVVRLWSAGGTFLHTLRGHGDRITDLRFNSDGSRLASASQGSSSNAIMWDVSRGTRLHTLFGQFGTVTAVSFSFDDRWILTAGPIVVLWPTDAGSSPFYVRGPEKLLTDAEWVPQSYRVVSSVSDGTVRTYACEVCVPLDQLIALAAQRLAVAR